MSNRSEKEDDPEVTSKPGWFEVAAQNGAWNWMLFSGNGRPMATNVTQYSERFDCTEAIKAIWKLLDGKPAKIVIVHKD